jgi:hypothetical protein
MKDTVVYGEYDLTGHLILFAKGHYGQPENVSVYERLVDFMWRWSWTPKCYFTPREIYNIVVDSFVESCDNKHMIASVFKSIYSPILAYHLKEESLTIEELISVMISHMGLIQIKEQDENNNFYDLVKLPEIKQSFIYGSSLPKQLQNYKEG